MSKVCVRHCEETQRSKPDYLLCAYLYQKYKDNNDDFHLMRTWFFGRKGRKQTEKGKDGGYGMLTLPLLAKN